MLEQCDVFEDETELEECSERNVLGQEIESEMLLVSRLYEKKMRMERAIQEMMDRLEGKVKKTSYKKAYKNFAKQLAGRVMI